MEKWQVDFLSYQHLSQWNGLSILRFFKPFATDEGCWIWTCWHLDLTKKLDRDPRDFAVESV